jgi:hypothetical protein
MRNFDPDHPLLVDVHVSGPSSTRIVKHACRLTPKRIYTAGGAIFDRDSGKRIISRSYAAMYQYRADPATLRPNPGYRPEPK